MLTRATYLQAIRTIRNVFRAKATRVIAVKRYRGREKVWRLRKVLFRKAIYRRVRFGSSMSAVCCWTVISNGSYGHLNNHLAHPPSLNSHYFFSRSLLLFPRTSALSEAHALTIREKRLLSLAFHFFTVTEELTIRYRQENRVTYEIVERFRLKDTDHYGPDEKSRTNKDVFSNITLLR